MTDTDLSADTDQTDLLALTADIVGAHVASNKVAPADLATFIAAVHGALTGLGKEAPTPEPEQLSRPIGIRASIKANGLMSMIDGKIYQSLKRHLGIHGHTPESYRQKFALPKDYPMVSAAYSEKRRALAKVIGLGTSNKKTSAQPKGPVRKKLRVAIDAAKEHLGG